jgi:non-ribosomal peptide synthetase component E (peptide arylation enzyme)
MASTDMSSVRNVIMGATTILPENFKQVFNIIKASFAGNAFGMSEGVLTTFRYFSPSDSYENVSTGPICAGARIRICKPDSRRPVQRRVPGEIHLGGPQVISSYLNGASPDSFYTDEYGHWLKSGDQGIMAENGELCLGSL